MTADELIARREALGLSRGELANRLGLPHVTIWRWETGERQIQMAGVLDLALQTLEREVGEPDDR